MKFLYQLLSKYSRIKRDGPSKDLFFSSQTLKKINQNNSYEKIYYFSNEKIIEKKNLQDFINNNFIIVDKYEINNHNNITYIHYVIENGKYRFHDDLEILIFNDLSTIIIVIITSHNSTDVSSRPVFICFLFDSTCRR